MNKTSCQNNNLSSSILQFNTASSFYVCEVKRKKRTKHSPWIHLDAYWLPLRN